jgi:hypothetical protein
LAHVGGSAMTLSVPSCFAAATKAFSPPPAAAVVVVAQLAPPLELDGELDEHPVAASTAAATPANANR